MKYGFEWGPGIVLWGLVLILPLAPPFALIAVVVLALAALAAVVALAGALVASPYLLVHLVRRRLAERQDRQADGPAPAADVAVNSDLAVHSV